MVVAVQVSPDGRVGVQIFPAARIPQHGSMAFNDYDWLPLEPFPHLCERVPDVAAVEFGQAVHGLGWGGDGEGQDVVRSAWCLADGLQGFGQGSNVGRRMGGRNSKAQPGLAAGHGWVTDGGEEDVLVSQ